MKTFCLFYICRGRPGLCLCHFTMTEVLGRLRSGPIRQPRCQILRFRVLQTRAGPRKTKETFSDSWQADLAKRVQRYQPAVDKAKVRLDLTATPRAWLMPSHMAINTERTVAYNNKFRQATPNMNLWLNNDVNKDTKKVGLRLTAEVLPKLSRQTITHLIPFTRRQWKWKRSRLPTQPPPCHPLHPATTSHNINKAMLDVGAVALTGL